MNTDKKKYKPLFTPGHTACAGCGQAIAARLVVDTTGKETIIANATGCLEVFSSGYPETSWQVPWIHSLFENTASVASGIEAALRYLGKTGITVISQAGDGGTVDIGLQAISGAWERGQNILVVCYDNEAYENTGVQRSGLTPYGATTSTTPLGNPIFKKPMPEIALAHGIPYVATATVGYPQDLQKKVKKAMGIVGPKYLQIHVPCPLGWRHESHLTYEVAKLAVETGLYPIIEYENGKLISAKKIAKPKPVGEYLKVQGRFKQTLNNPQALKLIQEIADTNITKYNLKAGEGGVKYAKV